MNIPGNVMAVIVGDMAGYGHISRELRKLPLRDVEALERKFSLGEFPPEWTDDEKHEAAFAAECIVVADYY